MALPMTHEEIRTSYRDAKQKSKQIGILADLNACPRKTIEDIVAGKEQQIEQQPYPFSEDKAFQLLQQGKSLIEVANTLGTSKSTMQRYYARVKDALPPRPSGWNKKKIETKKQEEPTMTDTKEVVKEEPIQATAPMATETVYERIDAILALRKATDSDTINKSFGDLCARLLAETLGL